jgi:hypothetical protein
LDLVTIFRVCFVIGIVAIPILYLLFGRRATGRNQDQSGARMSSTGTKSTEAQPNEESENLQRKR